MADKIIVILVLLLAAGFVSAYEIEDINGVPWSMPDVINFIVVAVKPQLP